MSALLSFAWTAWTWLRSLTWKQILAGLVTFGMAFLYLLGKSRGRDEERQEQEERDMELSEDIRERSHEAKERAAREVGALSDDELRERMRRKGRLRD